MRDRIVRALRAAASAPPGGYVSLTVPAPLRPVTSLLRGKLPGDRALWDDRADGGWTFACVGVATRVESHGHGSLARVRDAGASVLARVTDDSTVLAAPPPALFGGGSFDPSRSGDDVWAGFADASFDLPRWVYGRRDDTAFLRVTVPSGAPDATACAVTESDAVFSALEVTPLESDPGIDSRVDDLARTVWDAMVRDAIGVLGRGRVEKLVAARRSHRVTPRPLDPIGAVARATAADPLSVGFMLSRAGRYFIGATPERLVALAGETARADALAGSAPRGDGRAEALLASDKDRREHAIVVSFVRDTLGRFAHGDVVSPTAPVVRTLPHVHHLWTPVHTQVRRGTHVMDLVSALHPTPAVAGRPRDDAMAWIASNESVSRGWYAGPVGWFDAVGNGSFVVGLRSALVAGCEAWLYAGAGLVPGSTPEGEWAETTVKLRTMRSALGMDP